MPGGTEPQTAAFEDALVAVDRVASDAIFRERLSRGTAVDLADGLLGPALESIGSRWERGELALSQVYMAGRICEQLVDRYLPEAPPGGGPLPRMAIAVFEDHHVLGKRIVSSLLRSTGHPLADYGHGLGAEALLPRLEADRIEVLLLSCLMVRSALGIRELVEGLRRRGMPVRVLVGGAPFRLDPALAAEVGADGWGATASDALRLVRDLLPGEKGKTP